MSAVIDARARAKIQPVAEETIQGEYLQSLRLIERLHRLLLDVIKDEFQRQGGSDLNSVQALLIYNIGESELTAGDLKRGGYYLGSNVSYNLKKLVDMGYIHYKKVRNRWPQRPREPDAEGPRRLHGRQQALPASARFARDRRQRRQ